MVQNVTYAFGPFRLDTSIQLLQYEKETAVSLQPKIYRLLLYFLQHPGRLLSREELLAAVWKGTIVEDTALRLAVNTLRKALRDDSKTPRYIATVCKRGYRFIAEVTFESEGQSSVMSTAVAFHYRPQAEFLNAAQRHDVELAQLLEAFEQAAEGNKRLFF